MSITLIDIKGKNSQGIEYFKKFPLLFRHLKGSGLLELSIKKSEWLDKALDLAKSSEEKSELIKALCKTNKKGYSALYGIIKDKPSLLEKIFNLVKTQEDKSTLIKAFCYLDKDGISLAHRLMKYAPEFVGDLFNLAVVPKDKSKLITVFSYVGEDKVCLAHRLMKYAPKFTNNLLNLATNPQDISTLIAAFSYLDEDGASLAYKYIGYEAEFAGKLLSLPMTPEDKTQLISVFSYINGDGVSPAHELMKYAPEFIGDLLNLAVAPKDKSKLITAFSYAGEDKVCLAHRLMKHAPEFIGDLLSLATNPKDKSKLIKSFCADGRETYNNILEKLINCEDEALLEQFLNLASTDEDRKAVISCFCRNTPCRFNFFKKRNRSLYEDIMVGKKFNFLQPFFIYNKFHSIFEYEDWEDLIYDDFFQKFLTIVNHSSIGQCVIGFGIYSLKDHELHDVVIALDKWGIDLASDKEVGFSEWNKLAKDSNFRYVLLLLDCLDINSNKVLANWQALKKDPIKAFFTIVGLGDQYAKYPNTLWHEFKYSYESLKEIDPDIYCDLDLGESEYTKKILKNPHKFYYSYKRLKDIKLNQTGYIGKIIENPESIDDIELNRYALLKLNKLGPVQQKDIDYVIREPEDFNKRCSYLEKIKSIHSYIDKRSEKLKKIYGGEEIKKSNTEIKVKVATGISQIWNEITDDKGEFNVKYSNSISIYKKIGSILKERRQKKFHTIFLRDEFTKRAYNNIGTVAKNLDLSRV
ncbi:hypothetical protein A0O36_02566 [Piscirickettsiaceae bacterium NZ-RLO1]|nr:hypothetical protein A0O36_02566 [Piscirickettsiaceae bacterium NZ-RLO1]